MQGFSSCKAKLPPPPLPPAPCLFPPRTVKGDMLVLPEGIYHRFTLDESDYIVVSHHYSALSASIPGCFVRGSRPALCI